MLKSSRSPSTRSRKLQVAASVLVNDTRRRIRNSSKDLSSSEIEFRLTLSRAKLADIQQAISERMSEVSDLRKSGTDTQHTIAELEQLLAQRA